MLIRRLLAVVLLGSLLAGSAAAESGAWDYPVALEDLAITVSSDHPREYIFTDKGAAHLAGEAVGPDTRSYHGFYIAMHEVVDGWSLRLEDGTEVGPNTAFEALVTPDQMVRRHRLPSGEVVTETVQLFDRQNGFRVAYDGVPAGRFEFLPRIDMRFLWRVGRPAYEVRWENGALLVCRQDAVNNDPDPDHPHWLAVTVGGATDFQPDGSHLAVSYPKGKARKAMDQASPFLPGALVGRIPSRMPSGRVEAVFAADVGPTVAADRAWRLGAERFELMEQRRARLRDLVAATRITTGVPRDDAALAWSRISLDNLIMDQRGLGIYAGFYWFTTYWGRDTFISLPGACIASGDFELAKGLLRSFSEFQMRDETHPRMGRLPNFVTVEQVQYASIDGTWWFVRAVDELLRQSGDEEFAREMAQVVFWAVAGAEIHATDENLFLVHGDGETWMDAGGEDHPYSPRGTRAVEVQALWHRGLLTVARLAERFPVGEPLGSVEDSKEKLAAEYRAMADKLAANFHQKFWRDGRLVDHLNADGSGDTQVRPNGLLAVMSSPTLFTQEQRDAITAEAARELVKPWGVLSLHEADPFFHPKHLDLDSYYYDEAYHNGDLWLWLSGAYVSALNRPAEGFGQTRMLLDEALDEGAVGTIQEIRDGARAATNDEFGGATSQAWSLAELLRNVVQDYAGLKVDMTANPPLVRLAPSLPEAWPGLSVRSRIGEQACLILVGEATGEPSKSAVIRFAGKPDAGLEYFLEMPGRDRRGGRIEADPENEAWPWRVVWR